jgi:hypothetical protein
MEETKKGLKASLKYFVPFSYLKKLLLLTEFGLVKYLKESKYSKITL